MAVATRTLENFIAGRWVPASSDRTVDDVNPADTRQQNRTDQRKDKDKGIRRLLRAIFGDGH